MELIYQHWQPVVNTRLVASRNNTYRSIEQNEKREEQVIIRGRKLGLVDSEQSEREKKIKTHDRTRRAEEYTLKNQQTRTWTIHFRVVRSLIRASSYSTSEANEGTPSGSWSISSDVVYYEGSQSTYRKSPTAF